MSDSQVIITISREYGSGGHAIAVELAERLGLKLYDHNLLDEIAAEKGVDPNELHKYDEMPRKPFLSRSAPVWNGGFHSSAEINIAYMQFDYLKKKAAAGESFVVVGRCAEGVFKDFPGLISIFVLGERETKCRRIMELYQLSEKAAYDKMNRHDIYRKRYHNTFCEDKWGDSRGYDLCINSSVMGVEGTTDMLETYIRARMQTQD
jgi:cytidylate kinase